MQEKRLTLRLVNYWDSVRKEEDFPDIRHFNPSVIDDIWTCCFRVGVVSRSPRMTYKYTYMGKDLIELYGRDLAGQMVEEQAPEFPGMVIHKKFNDVVNTQHHLEDNGYFVTRHNKFIKYRACLLPFGNAKEGVTDIIIGISFRVF